jgi:hypothetical protein
MTRARTGLLASLSTSAALTATLVAGLVAAPAATAAPAAPAAPAALAALSTTAADQNGSAYGSSAAERQTLRAGCHGYRFRYRVDAPGDDWMAELTLVSPSGDALASHTFKQSAGDPRRATRRFRFCDVSTTPGRHTITMLVTAYDYRDESRRRSEPTRFRLTRR